METNPVRSDLIRRLLNVLYVFSLVFGLCSAAITAVMLWDESTLLFLFIMGIGGATVVILLNIARRAILYILHANDFLRVRILKSEVILLILFLVLVLGSISYAQLIREPTKASEEQARYKIPSALTAEEFLAKEYGIE